MRTAMTPDALARSGYRKVPVTDLNRATATHDEAYVFQFPSSDPLNEANGDGDLIEIIDWDRNLRTLWLDRGETIPVAKGMEIYVR